MTKQVQKPEYIGFVQKYLTYLDIGCDAADCYKLRCGAIHRGNASQHQHLGVGCVIFTIPETGHSVQGIKLVAGGKSARTFSLVHFCEAMIGAAERWYAEHHSEPNVVVNMPKLLSLRPEGIFPFVEGPLIGSEL
ncbi:MAG: hypothetical protein ACK5SX_02765 [Sandaracinobacter sp.]